MEYLTNFFLPSAESTYAANVDALFHFINIVSLILLVGITIAIVYFSIKYRRKSQEDTTPLITHNTTLEVTWTVIPLILILIVFGWGFNDYVEMRTPPANSYEVYVESFSFGWNFEHPNGIREANQLTVPVAQPVRLIMRSRDGDVLHSFFVPQFRLKQDLMPNRYTYAWFEAIRPGEFVYFCTEYCGGGHSMMNGIVRVKTQEDFDSWTEEELGRDLDALPLAELGRLVYTSAGCQGCHSLDGASRVGPTFAGLYMRERQFTDGSTRIADEAYLIESIVEPQVLVNVGYPNNMPNIYAQTLSEREILGLVEFIKELQ
ncbi:MAG: cytochrome c oxidase subunit II [Candidatus Cyclonatronum sp.]|uniref:cytochrome c oxidase subunit II n=1 Tax=Cyclonatronum sp. TaxID=3024185 RepID=UPI0025B9E7F8|nr:cytochrome c oxidase subunit II [Cyclonatronum sp.]MCC5933610.1 cytochrome c oxidase subunit II [Balneolales bacterium]MCH8485946.1 cytochrome c oxidase subunit II [Cyclonatronum sp.]